MEQVDVIVLGAGIVGASTAVHLQQSGQQVVLVDRRQPGEETSFGNAGIVERNGFQPITIPAAPSVLLGIAFKQSTAVNYDLATLIKLMPWLWALRKHGTSAALQAHAHAIGPLKARAILEHQELAKLANAERFYRKSGWLHLFRSAASFRADEGERHYARIFGVDYRELEGADINSVEPGLKTDGLLGVFWPESASVSNPGAVTSALWRYLIQRGGQFFTGDALKLERKRSGWRLVTPRAVIEAPRVVAALGPWSGEFAALMGEHFPLAVKRGYHVHFRPRSGASLSRPVVDIDNGYAMTPMEKGIRLTTGVEFADRDAPPSPVQIMMAKKRAEGLFPLGRAVEETPWMGSRPCLPDSLPIVGPSPANPGLWYNFGHGHAGFTLGPVTGRLLAEMILGRSPCVDPAPLSPLRFAR